MFHKARLHNPPIVYFSTWYMNIWLMTFRHLGFPSMDFLFIFISHGFSKIHPVKKPWVSPGLRASHQHGPGPPDLTDLTRRHFLEFTDLSGVESAEVVGRIWGCGTMLPKISLDIDGYIDGYCVYIFCVSIIDCTCGYQWLDNSLYRYIYIYI